MICYTFRTLLSCIEIYRIESDESREKSPEGLLIAMKCMPGPICQRYLCQEYQWYNSENESVIDMD